MQGEECQGEIAQQCGVPGAGGQESDLRCPAPGRGDGEVARVAGTPRGLGASREVHKGKRKRLPRSTMDRTMAYSSSPDEGANLMMTSCPQRVPKRHAVQS